MANSYQPPKPKGWTSLSFVRPVKQTNHRLAVGMLRSLKRPHTIDASA